MGPITCVDGSNDVNNNVNADANAGCEYIRSKSM